MSLWLYSTLNIQAWSPVGVRHLDQTQPIRARPWDRVDEDVFLERWLAPAISSTFDFDF